MDPQEILDQTRKAINDCAADDPDKWFYANRFVFARLQLDERRTKTQVKKQLLEDDKPCHYCHKPIDNKVGVHLHRLDAERGYSLDNSVLMHPDCHTKYHAENPRGPRPGRRPLQRQLTPAAPVLEKVSKRYEAHSFIYWWDISPRFAEEIDRYEAVEFVKKDTGERCHVPTAALKGYLTEDRKTSRGKGNWGIKVLKDNQDQIGFEPAKQNHKWLFLPVVWLNDTRED